MRKKNREQTVVTLIDHANIQNKVWYGEDLMVGMSVNEIGNLPGVFKNKNFAFLLVVKGEVDYRFNLNESHWEAPCLVALLPGSFLEYISVSSDSDALCMSVSEKWMQQLHLKSDYNMVISLHYAPHTQLTEQEKDTYLHYFQILFALAQSPQSDVNDCIIMDLLQSFMHYSMVAHDRSVDSGNTVRKERRGERICLDFFQLIQQQMGKRALSFYAAQLHISVKYLSNVVKRVTGETANVWLNRGILYDAKILLYDSTLTIQQISERLNFSSPSHFGTFFKREMGISPLEFRRGVKR